MSASPPLRDLFLPHLEPDLAAAFANSPELEASLASLWETATAAWPAVALTRPEFFAFLARRVDPATPLRQLRADDLYLLCAYLQGTPGASQAFESGYLAPVTRALARVRATADEVAEVTQNLRLRLLLDRATDPRRRHYVGSGSLVSWLCVSGVREVWHLRRGRNRGVPLEDHALQQLPARDESHELTYLKRLYRHEFKQAFAAALESLSPRDRNILRYYTLKGLNIAEIGAIYQVHRATIARWIARARQQLLENTQASLLQAVKVEGRELESIFRLIVSQLDVSLQRHLADPEAPPGDGRAPGS